MYAIFLIMYLFHVTLRFHLIIIVLLIISNIDNNISKQMPFRVPNNFAYAEFLDLAPPKLSVHGMIISDK